ncbi:MULTISPECIES: twin-arginine translocation signal domain-containing protein [unclassified Campylobacter]|uniref:twin-arginine translocation signal domain-containing protein n=1 Tax=unclassified Campylobacter TaxID=2593542 RepID=UPI001BDA034A|nr:MULTISPECIES: twin-arginine translocation signal domain-containing protein [unclassified Campylobacter]MBZ7975600.1 twin-arginine translocation signal domain-containing protein [Campylobacter sp. RM12637]MBZ7980995.1 twin-arginine translocation signal domain-containing protein [Campylobacter sp. RM12640]MBZ7983221.1 twin-arginine translocation signal domain-containing protein [Campylobacter sp. RM12647]MBZ7988314.1 twin-arginine translocation signal domain-containing protein [Campylobacter s
MENKRRAFLKKALSAGATCAVASVGLNAATSSENNSSGVVSGRAKKKEVLYKKTLHWEKFYKIAY